MSNSQERAVELLRMPTKVIQENKDRNCKCQPSAGIVGCRRA